VAEAPRTADEIVAYVQNHDHWRDKPPVRNTLMTRISEQVRRGTLVKQTDGRYALAPHNGSAPSGEPTGADQADPADRVRRETGAGQSHPDGGLSSATPSGPLAGERDGLFGPAPARGAGSSE
jgi:hypothetical protein